jgi:hypothetical protein
MSGPKAGWYSWVTHNPTSTRIYPTFQEIETLLLNFTVYSLPPLYSLQIVGAGLRTQRDNTCINTTSAPLISHSSSLNSTRGVEASETTKVATT